MYIYTENGHLLKCFDCWDVRSVQYGERWIKEHGYYIVKCEIQYGLYHVFVRGY